MMKLGLTFFSVLKMPVRDIIECAKLAEREGFGYISIGESFYRDGFALSSAIASATRKIRFGTSVMPIFTRSPFQLAIGTATLQEISDGRVAFLGLGVGYRGRTEHYFGVKQAERVQRMREYVEILRRLFSGEDASYHGRLFDFRDFPRLTNKPLNIPIFLGSSGRRMLELAGEIADGVILNSISTPEYVESAREWIAIGADRAGRKPAEIEIGHSIIYAVAEDPEEAANAAKEDILFYASYPELNPILEESPFHAEALKMRELYAKGRRKEALSLISEEMLEAFAVHGTLKDGSVKLANFLGRGITLPIIRVSVSSYRERERKAVFTRAITSLANFVPQTLNKEAASQ